MSDFTLYCSLQNEAYKLTAGTGWAWQPAPAATSISLCAARADAAAFQAVLCPGGDCFLNLSNSFRIAQDWSLPVVRAALRGPFPASLALTAQTEDDDRLTRADAILSADAAVLRRGEPRALWAEIAVPADAAAGAYRFTLDFYLSDRTSDEVPLASYPVSVEVIPCRLPQPDEFRFHLDLWQHPSNIARKHETPLWSDAHFEVLEKYVRSLAALGQKAVTVVASEIPWGGQGCANERRLGADLFEYSMIPVTRRADGTLLYDFSVMQRYIDLCARCGIREEISVYGLSGVWSAGGDAPMAADHPDCLRVSYYDEADGCRRFLRRGAELDGYVRAIGDYFRETGQLARVRFAADEPADTDKYRRILARLFSLIPDARCKAAINHAEFVGEFGREVSDYAPFIDCLLSEYGQLDGYRRTMPGKRFLWYVCCGPDFPNTFLRSALTESYFIGAFTSFAGLDGFLRWNYAILNDDPRADVRYGPFPAGDVNFVYPQKNGAPLLSLRYKALRRGIELYELLERAKELAPGAAEAAFSRLFVREAWGKTRAPRELAATVEYAEYAAVRGDLLRALAGKI